MSYLTIRAGLGLLLLQVMLALPAHAETCVTSACHAGLARVAFPHQPVAGGECLACHEQRRDEHPLAGGKSFALTAAGADLCYQCHEEMGRKRVVHPPVREGDCLSCHRPHGASNRYLLEQGGNLAPLCFGCHEEAPFRQAFEHGPAAMGACTRCHSPHDSREKKLLRGPVRELCLTCHEDFARQMREAAFVHSPVREEPCTACHRPHAAPVPFFLGKKMPELCLDCHDETGRQLAAKVPHPPVAEAGSCGTCHSTHFSQDPGLLGEDEMSLCLGCHGGERFRRELAAGKVLHGPLQEGKCSPCHDPHGSDFFRLLRGRYPEGFYFSYTEGGYDFCLQCHQENLLRFPDTSIYTNFRDGKRNLHYLHVAGTRKGRTCRLCHEPHAGDGPKLTNREGMEFGDWRIPIRLELTPTGGSCAPGCHRPAQYDRSRR